MKLPRIILLSIILLTMLVPVCSAATLETKLTEAEKEFIKTHPVIRLGIDPKFIPYEFIDTDGTYKGIAADYLKLISERTGLQFEVEKNLTWEQAHKKGVQKQLDALPCVGKTKERERYFLFSDSYYLFQRVLFINENNTHIKSFADLANRSVAVQVNSSHHGYLKHAAPNTTLNLYNTVEAALKAVADGTEEAFVGNLATSSYLAKANGITNLKYLKMETDETQFLYIAVRNDWPILVGILNKALADISEAEKIEINNRWIGVEHKTDYTRVIKIAGIIGAVVAIIFAVSAYWIIRLKNEVKVRKQVEAQLKIAKEEAEYANHIKSTFLARMSHEIRTPLNAIAGITYLIKKTDVTSMQKKYLDKITRSAHDMLCIINDILDFSKIEAGKVDLEKASFNLDDMLQHIISILAYRIEEQNIGFSIERDPRLPMLFMGDRKRIQQILLNLVNNAVKFTEDGKVAVAARLVAKVKNCYRIEFSVQDTGIGMSSEQLKQVFTPFSQADASICRRFGGTGLGLSIVKHLVELMGGSIEASSAVGEGSTFKVQLTLEADENPEYEEKKKIASVYFRNIRVLVVEKSSFYTSLLGNYLRSFNIAAEFAASEARALELLTAGCREEGIPYNLIIIDYETLQEGAIAFRTKVKELSELKEVPKFVVMIPITKEELFEKLEAAGLSFVITKPITPSLLYNEIVETLKINVLKIHDQSALMNKEVEVKLDYPYHVLIVEDNKTNQFIAQSILTETGFRVTLTDNGLKGYEVFRENPRDFDVILMDLHMPVMNGYETTELIRKLNSDIPIIAMTADAIVGVEEKCRNIGINYYISKPFDPEQFVARVLQVVQASKNVWGKEREIVQEDRTEENSPVLDEVNGIKHMGGKAELYYLVLKEYNKENQETAEILRRALENKDYKAAVQIVHKLKSSSGSIGAKKMYESAANFQRVLTAGDKEEISVHFNKFAALLKRLLGEIERRISSD